MDTLFDAKKIYCCQYCDAIISAWYTRRKFCSHTCRGKAVRTRIFKCEICGIEFEPNLRNTAKRTCSKLCANVLRTLSLEKLRLAKVPKQEPCPICGSLFNVYGNNRRRRRTCSNSCRVKYSWRLKERKSRTDTQPRSATNQFIKKATPPSH